MTPIDHHRAIELLRLAVQTRGETTVIQKCRYSGTPAEGPCIVGESLLAHGWTIDDLMRLDEIEIAGQSWTMGDSWDHHKLYGYRIPELTYPAWAIFAHAQHVQDDCRPWSEALEQAEETYARFVELLE